VKQLALKRRVTASLSMIDQESLSVAVDRIKVVGKVRGAFIWVMRSSTGHLPDNLNRTTGGEVPIAEIQIEPRDFKPWLSLRPRAVKESTR
jgi:hypothetical protein